MVDWELDVRPVRSARIAVAAAAVLLTTFTVGGIWLRHSSTGVTFYASDQIAMIVLGVVLAGAALLFTRPRLKAGAAGVVVRNLFGDKAIPWDLVRGLSFPDRKAWARIELPADEYVPVLALRASDKSHAADAVERFRALAARHTA
ncbi:MAG: PH domain-containing protein [Mycobacteriaceae bacterium]|nr:PH domain-containing protein [Mycobacteriaceae bacterium]